MCEVKGWREGEVFMCLSYCDPWHPVSSFVVYLGVWIVHQGAHGLWSVVCKA